jgi:Flp pilus assembly secretin CpaC
MVTIHVPRNDVSVEEVSNALRQKLGASYRITSSTTSSGFGKEAPDDANTAVVKGFWFDRANIRIVSGPGGTEIEVSPGATYFGLVRLIDRAGIARKVHRALQQAFVG